jgi:hypothetical protein
LALERTLHFRWPPSTNGRLSGGAVHVTKYQSIPSRRLGRRRVVAVSVVPEAVVIAFFRSQLALQPPRRTIGHAIGVNSSCNQVKARPDGEPLVDGTRPASNGIDRQQGRHERVSRHRKPPDCSFQQTHILPGHYHLSSNARQIRSIRARAEKVPSHHADNAEFRRRTLGQPGVQPTARRFPKMKAWHQFTSRMMCPRGIWQPSPARKTIFA